MLVHGIIGFGSVIIASVLSYAYHFIFVRLLPPEAYGSLSVIIGVFTIFVIPTQTIQRIVARDIAKLSHEGKSDEIRYVFQSTLKSASTLGVSAALILILSAYAISSLYHEQRLLRPLQLLGVLTPLWYVSSVLKGYVQGREKMFFVGLVLVLEQAVKVALAVVLVFLGYRLFGAAAPLGVGAFFVIPLLYVVSRKDLRGSKKAYETSFDGSFKKIFATEVLLMAFIYLDLFYVKKFLSPADAGYYNVAALTSKVLMYSMGGIMYAFLPKASKLTLGRDWSTIRTLMFKSALILLPLFIALSLFPEPIVRISYTSAYLPAVPALRILLAGMFLYALFTIPLNLMWSQKEEDFPLALSAAVLLLDAALLYWLVPAHGLLGAAYATTLSSMLLFALSYAKIRNMRTFNPNQDNLMT